MQNTLDTTTCQTVRMGLLTPVAVKVGSISWMPTLLPQIVRCDKALQRLTRDRVGLLDIAGLPHITLRVSGRTTGIERSTELLAVPDSGGWLIAGSYFGGPTTPQWVANVRAADSVIVVDHGRTSTMTAHELTGDSRDNGWQKLRSVWPNFDLYEQRTDRLIPVFRLEPIG